MIPKFSICIPTWEQYGYGLQYLNDLIHSLEIQTFQDYEIVISDHSKDYNIRDFLVDYYRKNQYRNIQMRYEYYDKNYGNGVSNLNNALRMATGEIIKIMFQDDFMFSGKCLEKVNECFKNPNNNWMLCGCNHTRDNITFERKMVPSWNDKLLEGINTISSPSVLVFRNQDIEYFDENLTMLMDVEYYYRLKEKYGMPIVIEDCCITNRQHPNQISSRYKKNINDEIKYVRNKHKK